MPCAITGVGNIKAMARKRHKLRSKVLENKWVLIMLKISQGVPPVYILMLISMKTKTDTSRLGSQQLRDDGSTNLYGRFHKLTFISHFGYNV
jgi:hypothetical protein